MCQTRRNFDVTLDTQCHPIRLPAREPVDGTCAPRCTNCRQHTTHLDHHRPRLTALSRIIEKIRVRHGFQGRCLHHRMHCGITWPPGRWFSMPDRFNRGLERYAKARFDEDGGSGTPVDATAIISQPHSLRRPGSRRGCTHGPQRFLFFDGAAARHSPIFMPYRCPESRICACFFKTGLTGALNPIGWDRRPDSLSAHSD